MTRRGSTRRRTRAGLSLRAALSVLGALLALAGPGTVPAWSATTGSITGTVYWDLDDDGVRDATEPGLPGIVVRTARASTLTDAAGRYAFAGVAATETVRVDTGWLRSQCLAGYSGPSGGAWATAACPDPGAGAGPDQQFVVNNQFLTARVAPGGRAWLGLVPDRVGTGYQPATSPPTTVDPALRLSPGFPMGGPGTLCRGYVCRPGEKQWVLTQWMDQGTAALSGIKGVIVAPAGSLITQVRPYTGHGPGSGHGITGYKVIDPKTGKAVAMTADGVLARPLAKAKVRLIGRLVPAGAYFAAVAFTVDPTARFSDGNQDGVPDCSATTGGANVGQVCARATDYAPGSYIAYGSVTALAQGLDTDAVFCPSIPLSCPVLGVHNKVLGGDSNDGGAWKVDSIYGPGVA